MNVFKKEIRFEMISHCDVLIIFITKKETEYEALNSAIIMKMKKLG